MGRTALSKKELQRGGVMARVRAGELRVKDAAELMRVSYRQAKRIWQRYGKGGTKALKHGNAGRASNRRRPEKERKKILRKVEQNYSGFDRRWRLSIWPAKTNCRSIQKRCALMLEQGLAGSERKRKAHRGASARTLESWQMDGSFMTGMKTARGKHA